MARSDRKIIFSSEAPVVVSANDGAFPPQANGRSILPVFAQGFSTGALEVAARRLVVTALVGVSLLAMSNQVRSQQINGRAATFIEIIEFVQKAGWLVKLGKFCTQLELPSESDNCTFRQVSLQETEGRGDPRGFYVPVPPDSAVPSYVIVIHERPLVREVFVASPQSVLIRAYYRSKRAGYNPIPNADVEHEFKKDIAYWTENLARIKRERAREP